jgi:hypothetical protein
MFSERMNKNNLLTLRNTKSKIKMTIIATISKNIL